MTLNVFLDDGGVMNDNAVRGPAWERLLGEFFAPRLGGDNDAWAEANRHVTNATDWWAGAREVESGAISFAGWDRRYQLDWVRSLAGHVGVTAPSNDDECLALAHAAADYVTPRVESACPGAPEAIRELSRLGCRLYTASGEPSNELDGYLRGMGVRDHFTTLYGSDIVQMFKFSGNLYYARVFDHAGVSPKTAFVVDNAPRALAAAASVGARTVLITEAIERGGAPEGFRADFVIDRLADLPAVVGRIEAS